MSERDGENDKFRVVIAASIVGFVLQLGIVYYVNWNQAESIRDLQRRVGALESERRWAR